jgi:hypothetical protein
METGLLAEALFFISPYKPSSPHPKDLLPQHAILVLELLQSHKIVSPLHLPDDNIFNVILLYKGECFFYN